MDTKEAHKRLNAAYALLAESTTTREKFNHVSTLIRGMHPSLDTALDKSNHALSTLGKIEGGDVIGLSAEHLPETTEEQKRYKKYLLLFIKSWRDLKGEVARVQAEMDSMHGTESAAGKASALGKIFNFAKGPLGITTIVAAGIVLTMQQTSVNLTIQNQGCGTMQVSGGIPVNIPGLKLPKDPIPSGGSAVLAIPPLSLSVDGTQSGSLSLSALNYSFGFELPNNIQDVTLDGESLLGKTTKIKLSEKDDHVLTLKCL